MVFERCARSRPRWWDRCRTSSRDRARASPRARQRGGGQAIARARCRSGRVDGRRPGRSRAGREGRRRRGRDEQSVDIRIYTDDMKTGGRVIAVGLLAACALVGFSAAFALAAGADSGPVQSTDDARAAPDDRASADIPAARDHSSLAPARHSGRRQHCPRRRRRAPSVSGRRRHEKGICPTAGARDPHREGASAPAALGAKPAIRKAVSRARFARPGAVVPLRLGLP